jgi:hypothetical protein
MPKPSKTKPSRATRAVPIRPMRNILQCLPTLPVTKKQEIDFQAADPAMLIVIAEDAEMLMRTTYCGLGAIGQLLANSAVMIEDGSISADCVEALGWFQSEMADMAHHFMCLAAHCREETADYLPPSSMPAVKRIDSPMR